MTPQTAKDLAELGMTPEQLQERQTKVSAILGANGATSFDPATVEALPTPPARSRRTRSDKGTTRPQKPEPAAPAQASMDDIVLRVTLTEARMLALGEPEYGISAKVQDQIIAQLKKRLDSLTASK